VNYYSSLVITITHQLFFSIFIQNSKNSAYWDLNFIKELKYWLSEVNMIKKRIYIRMFSVWVILFLVIGFWFEIKIITDDNIDLC
jgi:hypothetical protein